MKKLRLLFTKDCPRACPGCCNNDWDLDKLPHVENYAGFDEIIITGGEPMLYPRPLISLIEWLREKTTSKIYLYTAYTHSQFKLLDILRLLDGLTLTLHEKSDVIPFCRFNRLLNPENTQNKTLRLNVFEGIDLTGIDLSFWQAKEGIVWIENCPLPEGEVFLKYSTF